MLRTIEMYTNEYKDTTKKEIRKKKGQFFTPAEVSMRMAAVENKYPKNQLIRVLDPGAGNGILSFAVIDKLLRSGYKRLDITLIETDKEILPVLEYTITKIRQICESYHAECTIHYIDQNFVLWESSCLYDIVICNPPYMKVRKDSIEATAMKAYVYGQPNLYGLFMAKTEETLIIEDVLYQNLFGSNPCLAREYGTKEVTVTLLKEKKVKEIVDFLSYNAKKDEFRCYEIKVSMADFKSKAAKTWIGNYNYLVIPRELYLKQSLYEWKEQIPYYVGIIVVNVERRSKWVAKRPSPMEVSAGMKFMLRQSLIRTLFYQNDKLKKNSAAKIEQICQETEK